MAKQLLGKEVTAAMNEKLQAKVAELQEKGVTPKLGIIRCGENPSDLSYEKGAMSRAALIGVEVERFLLPEDVTKEALIAQIEALNADASIHGVLLFRPLPKQLKSAESEICNHLRPEKDIDCMTDLSNAGVFMGKQLGFAPCTPQACMEILDHYGIDCKGKTAVVIGRSLVVGRPAAMMRDAAQRDRHHLPHEDGGHRCHCPAGGYPRHLGGRLEQPDGGLCPAGADRHRRFHQLGPDEEGRQGRHRGGRGLCRCRAHRRGHYAGARRGRRGDAHRPHRACR